jgi:hypothetical protein
MSAAASHVRHRAPQTSEQEQHFLSMAVAASIAEARDQGIEVSTNLDPSLIPGVRDMQSAFSPFSPQAGSFTSNSNLGTPHGQLYRHNSSFSGACCILSRIFVGCERLLPCALRRIWADATVKTLVPAAVEISVYWTRARAPVLRLPYSWHSESVVHVQSRTFACAEQQVFSCHVDPLNALMEDCSRLKDLSREAKSFREGCTGLGAVGDEIKLAATNAAQKVATEEASLILSKIFASCHKEVSMAMTLIEVRA